jgi:D-beta-D-heptose 7-phosphate kinase/D-beta-D-heptose 1-phosphate adenosyltransferase
VASLARFLDQFSRQRILVIGDVILDHYVRGSVSRTSPEAPVPILAVEDEEWLPGGAANVASNLVTLGARVDLYGLIGDDEAGARLRTIFRETSRLQATLFTEPGRPTILKTRAVAQGQQMLRLDRERITPVLPTTAQRALAALAKGLAAGRWSGIILSDYGKGFLEPFFLQQIIAAGHAAGVPIFVDPKGSDYARYRGVTVLTPNQKEASEASGIAIRDDATAAGAARRLQATVRAEAVVITRGAGGVSVFPRRGKPVHMPARAREVFDVTGAGDTFLSVLALARFSGAGWAEAAELGNLAAGIVVGMVGVATVSPEALRNAVETEGGETRRKVLTMTELEQVCRSLRSHGSKVVLTNGYFDLLHHGHIHLLREARGLGDALIVALNSDASTRRHKGEPRPILPYRERSEMLAAFPFVDYVVEFDEDTPEQLLQRLRPDVLVKGGPPGTDVVGRSIVEAYGGNIRLIAPEQDYSITSILARTSTPKNSTKKARRR